MTDRPGSSSGGGRSAHRPHDPDLAAADDATTTGAGTAVERVDESRQPLVARWDPTATPPPADSGPAGGKRAWLRRFAARYGWRAYALPALLALTAFVAVDAVRSGPGTPADSADPAPGVLGTPPASAGIIGAPPGDGRFPEDLPVGALPAGGRFTENGKGTWRVLPGTSERVGVGEQYTFRYTVEIENGIDTRAFGGDDSVAQLVESTLGNPKSWVHDRKFAFQRIDRGDPDFRISLTARNTTRETCGFEIPIDSSCYNSDQGRVVLSEARWVRGAPAFDGDIGSYRQYLVNHEVGHAIGYHAHQPCEREGALAPVMMQQTFGTANNEIAALDPSGVVPMDGKTCRFNPWPYPRG
ncbi:DUF3152 domain-containing protein [Nocardia carnea]|uniref:DUF3152 domain-containing protein n=2 Tax=Nocardia carnea TaxID=37328 RepID=UPI0024590822|nr:DUF3152 domain-containing protein [Nocardia carnea]